MSNENINELRKNEHLKCFLFSRPCNENGFDDVIIQNNSLPEVNFEDISIETIFLNKKISAPIMINAITGGTCATKEVNEQLAILAKKYNIPMAVGSQSIGISNKSIIDSYSIVRDINKDGVIISNLGALRSIEDMEEAIEMIGADAIQLHLNAAQEICMKEGDRNFKGVTSNIERAIEKIKVPIVMKEVGFGISRNVADRLYNIGINYIDIGGKGGTNFIQIEDMRNNEKDFKEFHSWGIETASSLIQTRDVSEDLTIIASGGISKAEEIIKALCLGANVVGITGILLKEILTKGYEAADRIIEDLIYKIKVFMLLLGAENISELRNTGYILKGDLKVIADHFGIK